MVEQPVKISFGVKRKEDKKVAASTTSKVVIDVEVDSDEEREKEENERQAKRRKMTHFDEGTIIGDEEKKKEAVVIPMVVEHDWRTQKLLEKEKEGTLTDEEKAKLALLVGTSNNEENDESNNGADKIVVSNGVETAEDADYSAVPIESFGLAILRGCNWKDGDGIGKNPQKVALKLPARRPHGLGLGATPKNTESTKKTGDGGDKKEEVIEIKKGTCIKIVDGRSKGLYGKVEARDDDANSLFVRLAIGSKSIKVSVFAVQGITQKEYDRDAKCLNKAEYDKEKEKIEKKREETCSKEPSTSSTYQEPSKSKKEKDENIWVRTDLLVRFIDKSYKNGKLYNQKVRVVDVAGIRDVTLEDDRGNTYYGVKQSWLETVIPRNIGDKLMIVGRKNGGKLAIMIDKDKRKEKVTAKLIQTSETLSVYFEDVCAVSVRHEEDYE